MTCLCHTNRGNVPDEPRGFVNRAYHRRPIGRPRNNEAKLSAA